MMIEGVIALFMYITFSKKTRSFQNCLVLLGYTVIKVIFISLNSYTALFVLEVHLDGCMRVYFENEMVISHYIIVGSHHKHSAYQESRRCSSTGENLSKQYVSLDVY